MIRVGARCNPLRTTAAVRGTSSGQMLCLRAFGKPALRSCHEDALSYPRARRRSKLNFRAVPKSPVAWFRDKCAEGCLQGALFLMQRGSSARDLADRSHGDPAGAAIELAVRVKDQRRGEGDLRDMAPRRWTLSCDLSPPDARTSEASACGSPVQRLDLVVPVRGAQATRAWGPSMARRSRGSGTGRLSEGPPGGAGGRSRACGAPASPIRKVCVVATPACRPNRLYNRLGGLGPALSPPPESRLASF
jgi:hypothetical protein